MNAGFAPDHRIDIDKSEKRALHGGTVFRRDLP